MSASDIENNASVHTSDRSNVTTDDEFFNEMMDAPPEFEDCLIPDQCQNEIVGLEHLVKCLNRRFNAYPVVFMGPLKDALREAFSPKDSTERRPLLIYVNNDKSIYTNLFCKQLLCNEKIAEYLMNNYVLWAWDVTYESNERKLNELCKTLFSLWKTDNQFQSSAVDRYPQLIAISRDLNGDYVFNYLIEGSSKKPTLDEFLGILIQFKDKFQTDEERLQKAKEEAKRQTLFNLFRSRDSQHRPMLHKDRDFLRSISAYHHSEHGNDLNVRDPQFRRLLSANMGMDVEQFFAGNPPSRSDMMRLFEKASIDSDDADDEDDDNNRTPTVARPMPKFP